MSRLDDLFGDALAPRPSSPRKAKPVTTAEAELLASLMVWVAPEREPYPPRPMTSGQQRPLPEYVYPRERPELARRCPGPEAVTDAEIAAWVDADPFVRAGLGPQTQRALAFIASFAPKPRNAA